MQFLQSRRSADALCAEDKQPMASVLAGTVTAPAAAQLPVPHLHELARALMAASVSAGTVLSTSLAMQRWDATAVTPLSVTLLQHLRLSSCNHASRVSCTASMCTASTCTATLHTHVMPLLSSGSSLLQTTQPQTQASTQGRHSSVAPTVAQRIPAHSTAKHNDCLDGGLQHAPAGGGSPLTRPRAPGQ